MMDSIGALALFLGLGASVVALALGPIGQALARRLAGKTGPGLEELEERVRHLEERSPITGETDLVAQRLLELEERLDFAERLLAARSSAAREPEARDAS